MKHYGDVSKINGAEIEPVDIITFGSPCQDLSVAGKRAGIQDGERSNLFFEAVRIIKEMRDSTNGEYPKYAVWENVPGAFSSNKGHDFHAVLEAFCSVCDDTVSIPKPYDAKRTKLVWNKAGEIVGDSYSIAWRTLDAQYWGVPQRRKRIYLVADFGSQRAGEILFKPDSLRGDFTQGNETGQGASADAVGGVDGSVGAAGVVSKGNGDCFIMPEKHMSLSIGGGQAGQGYPCVLHRSAGVECVEKSAGFKELNGAKAYGNAYEEEKAPTLTAGKIDASVVVLNDQGGSSINVEGETLSPTLRANSHQHEPVIAMATQQGGAEVAENLCPTITAAAGMSGNNQPVIALQANGIDRADTAGCNGAGWRENESYTLNTVDRHAVCYDARGNGDGETACTITGDHQNRITDYTAVAVQETKPPRKYIIRRLLPVECARLQGFPDKWSHLAPYDPADADFWEDVRKTHAEINGKKYKPTKNLKKWYEGLHTDSAEYKAYGNGLALPCAEYVIHGIAEQGAKTLGSLFDGIGGFPLAGVLNGITPLWASEVEPYPIAVTKSRFGEVHNGK